jgi:hypothetical protein
MKCKKLIGFMTAVMMAASMPSAARADDTEEVQLTDYRYDNMMLGLNGYSFANLEHIVKDKSDYNNTKLPINENYDKSVILKPDGTEIFQQGKYKIRSYFEFEKCEGERYDLYGNSATYDYPQCNNKFIVYDRETGKCGLIDDNGNLITDCTYRGLTFVDEDYLMTVVPEFQNNSPDKKYVTMASAADKLIRASDGEIMFDTPKNCGTWIYMSNDGKYYDHCVERGIKTGSNYEYFYDREGNPIDKEVIREKRGNENLTFDRFSTWIYEHLTVDENNMPILDQTDNSYVIKEKEIGGKTYYALFKQLTDGEGVADYTPKEQPSTWATDSISKATSEGLLYNNANCRYKANISRQDFCILAVEAYCKSQGMEIDDYIKANNITLDYKKFTDTDNAYVLLANKLGIVSGTSDTTFSPDRGITRQEAAVLLNNIANLCELKPNSEKASYTDEAKFATWAKDAIYNVSNIQNSDGVAIMNGMEENHFSPWSLYSREQAYVTIYRLYEMCNQR